MLREAWRLGQLPGEELEKVRDVRSVPGSAVPVGQALSKGELKSLMDGCSDGTPVEIRGAAVIALGYGAGLRRTEISGLSLEDIRTEGAGMVVRVVGNGAMEAIADYIEARGAAPGALLWSARKGGRLNEGAASAPQRHRRAQGPPNQGHRPLSFQEQACQPQPPPIAIEALNSPYPCYHR